MGGVRRVKEIDFLFSPPAVAIGQRSFGSWFSHPVSFIAFSSFLFISYFVIYFWPLVFMGYLVFIPSIIFCYPPFSSSLVHSFSSISSFLFKPPKSPDFILFFSSSFLLSVYISSLLLTSPPIHLPIHIFLRRREKKKHVGGAEKTFTIL